MTIGVVLLCRYSSSRLQGKILQDIRGRPLISHIVGRIRRAAAERPLVVATSDDKSDDPIAAYCRRSGIECFRGDLNDVAGRFLSCLKAYGWEYGVRINGDRLFLDVETLHAVLAIADTGEFDLVTNIPGQTFPYGLGVEIVRTEFYASCLDSMTEDFHREHVTTWFYENQSVGRRYVYENTVCPEAAGLQLAIDTPEDLDRALRILDRAGPAPERLNLRQLYELAAQKPPPSPWRGPAGPLLIAEIGGNHEGDFNTAVEMCEQAIKSGADCVKFQLYRGDSLVSQVESPDRHKHFQKFELTREQHIHLAEMCRQAGVGYTASVWDMEMLEWIDPYLDFYKIGSGDLTAWPLLREFARRGKPMLISTGLATLDEVLQTVSHIQMVDERYKRPEMLCLMQCTSMYPIPNGEANLLVMDAFRAQTGLSVGYSDHTVGTAALRTAAAMGADALEFHFTNSREGKTFRDHKVSLVAEEVQQLKKEIVHITMARGSFAKTPTSSELENHHELSFRRGVYLRAPVKEGERINSNNLVFLRPAVGTDARDADVLDGAVAKRNIGPMQAMYYENDYNRD